MTDDRNELEDLQYKQDGTIATERRDQNTVASVQYPLSSSRGIIEGYRQCWLEYA